MLLRGLLGLSTDDLTSLFFDIHSKVLLSILLFRNTSTDPLITVFLSNALGNLSFFFSFMELLLKF